MFRMRRFPPTLAALLALWLCLAQLDGLVHPLDHLARQPVPAELNAAVGDAPHHADDLLCLDCVAAAASAHLLATAERALPAAQRRTARPARRRHATTPRPRERQRNRSPPRR